MVGGVAFAGWPGRAGSWDEAVLRLHELIRHVVRSRIPGAGQAAAGGGGGGGAAATQQHMAKPPPGSSVAPPQVDLTKHPENISSGGGG
eukprot:2142255-Prymnesium_polylepis.1